MIYDVEINSAAHYPAADVPGLIELAEQVGFGAFWKGESNSTDPIVMLSAVASRTRKIKLGTAIYHIYGRSPVTLGIQAATLQDLSGGRLLLGLGVAHKSIAAWHGGVFDRLCLDRGQVYFGARPPRRKRLPAFHSIQPKALASLAAFFWASICAASYRVLVAQG